MKELIAKCKKCGKQKTFHGDTVKEILHAIDISGWQDFPENGDIKFFCEDCSRKKKTK